MLDEPGFEVRRTAEHAALLQIWGRLRPGWCGSLAEGLAQGGVGLTRGFARKIGPMRWLAELELDSSGAARDPLALDYLELAARTLPPGWRTPVELHSFTLTASEKHGGSLHLELTGADQIGFLGSLLTRFAFLSLFPEEMRLETQEGRVHDRFFLVGIGRNAPPQGVRDALELRLRSLVRK